MTDTLYEVVYKIDQFKKEGLKVFTMELETGLS